jgi:hypothetical protein
MFGTGENAGLTNNNNFIEHDCGVGLRCSVKQGVLEESICPINIIENNNSNFWGS